MDDRSTLRLTFQGDPGSDVDELTTLTRQLRSELLQLDLGEVHVPTAGPSPAGSKAVDAFAVGQLVVQFAASATSLTAVIGSVKSWLSRGRVARKIKLEIDGEVLELDGGVPLAEEKRLIQLFVGRHSRGPEPVTTSDEKATDG
jgi:hypothetical protein